MMAGVSLEAAQTSPRGAAAAVGMERRRRGSQGQMPGGGTWEQSGVNSGKVMGGEAPDGNEPSGK